MTEEQAREHDIEFDKALNKFLENPTEKNAKEFAQKSFWKVWTAWRTEYGNEIFEVQNYVFMEWKLLHPRDSVACVVSDSISPKLWIYYHEWHIHIMHEEKHVGSYKKQLDEIRDWSDLRYVFYQRSIVNIRILYASILLILEEDLWYYALIVNWKHIEQWRKIIDVKLIWNKLHIIEPSASIDVEINNPYIK